MYGLVCHFTPYQFDDLSYLIPYKDIKEGVSDTFDPQIYFNFFSQHYTTANGRFGDKLLPLILLLPKWVTSLLAAASIFIFLYYGNKIISGGKSHSPFSYLFILLMIVCPPWYDNIFVISYNVNYLYSAALTLTAIYYILYPEEGGGYYKKGVILIIALLAGSFHEGFSITLLPGILLYLILMRKSISRFSIFVTVALSLGALFIITAPGLWYRLGRSPIIQLQPIHYIAICNAYLALIIFLPFILRKKVRNMFSRKDTATLFLFFIASTINIVIMYRAYMGPRTFWFGEIYSIIALCLIFNRRNFKTQKFFSSTAFACIAMIAFIGHGICCVQTQIKLFKQNRDICRLYKESDDGHIFYDVTTIEDVPLATLMHVSGKEFYLPENWWALYQYYNKSKRLQIIPTTLQNARIENHPSLCTDHDIRNINGNLVTTPEVINPDLRTISIMCRLEHIGWIKTYAHLFDYKDINGNERVLVMPYISLKYLKDDLMEVKIPE